MKAVFFDWDGTLVDSLPLLHEAQNHVRSRFDLPLWSREEYLGHMLYSTRELFPRLYGERAQEAMDILYTYISDNHLQRLTLIEDAESILQLLKERGIAMGLVSNKRNDVLRREVEHLGWQKYFDVYYGAGIAKRDKPSGDSILHAVEQHPSGLKIDDIYYIGDTESDLSAAKEAGCPVIFVRHGKNADELISRYNPAFVVDTLAELKQTLIEILTENAAKNA